MKSRHFQGRMEASLQVRGRMPMAARGASGSWGGGASPALASRAARGAVHRAPILDVVAEARLDGLEMAVGVRAALARVTGVLRPQTTPGAARVPVAQA